ncbi:hypothetical protein [Streptomyces eurythermus]
MRQQAHELVRLTSSLQGVPVDGLARRLVETSPANLTEVHPKVAKGSPADEGTIKPAKRATGRAEVITPFRSHLRQTMPTAFMSGNVITEGSWRNSMQALTLSAGRWLALAERPKPAVSGPLDVMIRMVRTGSRGTGRGALLGKFARRPVW